MKTFVLAILLLLPNVLIAQKAVLTVIGSAVSATGKWKATTGTAGDELPFKHVVQIDCFQGHTCMEAMASVVMGEPDISIQYYEVVKRDGNGLVAESKAPECLTSRLIINFEDKTVLAIDSPKTGVKGFQNICKDKAINRTKTYQLVAR